jgi:hypothetical protein
MSWRTCGSIKFTKSLGLQITNSQITNPQIKKKNWQICKVRGRLANLTNYISPQIYEIYDIAKPYKLYV